MMGIKDGIDGGPIALFDAGTNAVFMTPFNSFMVATPRYDKNASTYGWGIVGEIQKLPPQYKVETILYYSDEGIREVSTVLSDPRPHTHTHTFPKSWFHRKISGNLRKYS